jgi:hypothetical protein
MKSTFRLNRIHTHKKLASHEAGFFAFLSHRFPAVEEQKLDGATHVASRKQEDRPGGEPVRLDRN